jgi:hypothetical protein
MIQEDGTAMFLPQRPLRLSGMGSLVDVVLYMMILREKGRQRDRASFGLKPDSASF